MKTNCTRRRAYACLLVAGSCMPGLPAAMAADLDTSFSAGIGRSDNILRTEEDPIEENISTFGIQLDFLSSGRKGLIDIVANGDYVSYRDDTFDSEFVGGATLFANYSFVEEVFDWNLEYLYGQQVFNPLSPVRPDNREDVTLLTTGPELNLAMGSRFFARIAADYSATNYEINPNDNDRIGVRASIGRRLSATRTLSLVGENQRVDFDDDVLAGPDYDNQGLFLRFESLNPRGSLTVDLGVNELELDGVDAKSDGTLFRVDWIREVAAGMELGLGAGSRYSDQGDIFRFLRNVSIDLRDTEDVAGVTAPFRNDYATATFGIDRERTRLNLVALYSDEDYEGDATLDREVRRLDLSVTRSFTRKIFGELGARTLSRKFLGLDRDDRDVQYTLALGYWITPTFSARLSFQHFDRSSNQDVTEFDEERVFLRFSYVPEWNREQQ